MSDSVSNAKVEDVLASIRRLVSEERRPFGAGGPNQGNAFMSAAEPGPRAEADRLLLTPSLRVAGPEPKRLDDQTDAVDDADQGAIRPVGDSDAAVASEAVKSSAAASEPDIRKALVTQPRHAGEPDAADGAEGRTQGASVADGSLVSSRSLPPEGTRAERTDQEMAEHDASSPVADLTEVLKLDETVRLPAPTVAGQDGEDHGETRRPPKGVTPEAAERHSDDDGREPREEASSEPLVLEPEDRSDGDPIGSASNPVTPEGSGAEPSEPESHANTLGEAELRDLVSEIVRQELRGALGERITSNVRKLVRREIQRALAMKDLD